MQPRSARSAMPRGLLSHLRAFLPDLLRSSLPRRFFSHSLKLGLLVALADSRSPHFILTHSHLTFTHSTLTSPSPHLHSLSPHLHFISYVFLMLSAFRRFSPLTGPLARFPRSSGYQSHAARALFFWTLEFPPASEKLGVWLGSAIGAGRSPSEVGALRCLLHLSIVSLAGTGLSPPRSRGGVGVGRLIQ